MKTSNFDFLISHQPALYKLGASAEDYVFSDPQSAVVKLRCFAELFVGFIYEELSLPTYGAKGFFERLDNAVFINAVEGCVVDKLHLIRLRGNKAAHPTGVSVKDALELVKEAWFLGAWLQVAYHGGSVDHLPKYSEPQPVTTQDKALKEDKAKLEAALDLKTQDLENAKAELAAAEIQQQATQDKLAALNLEVNEVKLSALKEASKHTVASFDFETEATREKIGIEDIFAEYQLTDGQTELVKRLDAFLTSKDKNVFLLKGYAGTGKTFITKGLTEYFRATRRNYVLSAPTGKAAKVISNKTQSPAHTIHKTIYSFKDIVEYRDEGVDGSETYKLYAKLAVNDLSVDTVYIVDESSMFSDIYNESEFFRCGSGHLLQDFLKFVNLDHNDHSKKVIFIGDDAQLPPVGMKSSPALDPEYLTETYNVTTTGYELTEVVRQKADSGVMKNAITMRKAINKNVFNQLVFDLNYSDLTQIDHADVISQYMASCGGKINAESIVIAHSNADVTAYNKRIREEFFPGILEVAVGDKLMAVTNSDAFGFFISNGDFGQVRDVFGETEKRLIPLRRKSKETGKVEEVVLPLKFRNVRVGFRDLEGAGQFFNAKIIENLLYSDDPNLNSDENKALYLDFCIRHPQLKPNSIEFKDTLKSDPYFNALRVKFGYAITCHKAQGSEWNHVFVKCKTSHTQLCAEYFRWLYTAITRTASNLYLMDAPDIKLGAGAKVVACPGLVGDIGSSPKAVNNTGVSTTKANPAEEVNSLSHYSDVSSDHVDGSAFGISEANTFLNEVFSLVCNCINDTGIKIDSIAHHQYQEAYHFSRGSESARVDVRYSGKNKIVSVIQANACDLANELEALLMPFSGRTVPVGSKEGQRWDFDDPFLTELHQKLTACANDSGMAITDVKELQNAQRYCFQKDSDMAVLDIYYNQKQQVTKYLPQVSLTSSTLLLNEVLAMLDGGLS